MWGAVIVMLRSRVLRKVHSKDHAVPLHVYGDEFGNRATPLSGTQLPTGRSVSRKRRVIVSTRTVAT